jgi:hypothetical protein
MFMVLGVHQNLPMLSQSDCGLVSHISPGLKSLQLHSCGIWSSFLSIWSRQSHPFNSWSNKWKSEQQVLNTTLLWRSLIQLAVSGTTWNLTVVLLLSFRTPLMDNWYSLSYLYFSTLGTLTTLFVGLLISLPTGNYLNITNLAFISIISFYYIGFIAIYSISLWAW